MATIKVLQDLTTTMQDYPLAAAQFADSFSLPGSYVGNIPAHSGDTPFVVGGGKFHFKPSIVSPAEKDLVKVSVSCWDTDFAHIQVAHGRADSGAQSTYSSTVAAT